ncbi:tetratricopeptide repeat protein [Oricola thermophila]|uniref:tetratricopeptide repeat protein n=1 Tax=Oricola thermophila TaxID=2742145 RepID=UPI001FE7A279|nr:tetratricopeptide repeat protein [Oricola thermophila]
MTITALSLAMPIAHAQEFGDPEPGAPLPVPEENLVAPPPVYEDVPLASDKGTARIDELFGELKKARDRRHAAAIAESIWNEWYRSGSATIDLFMTWANDAFEEKKYNVALDFLDQVVIRAPDFAEGWNRRATVHYAMDNFAKSMTDIRKALELEPRHFGALAGMATILERTGRKEAALKAWERALDVYPAMQSAQEAVIRLSDELAADPA